MLIRIVQDAIWRRGSIISTGFHVLQFYLSINVGDFRPSGDPSGHLKSPNLLIKLSSYSLASYPKHSI